ncbi:MAG: hypothetical protein JWO87_1372 [Phycisphaerales bacterium]|jgi:hypothetical protein|nr:hypothetical protein [Phycisphaerales bacterium]
MRKLIPDAKGLENALREARHNLAAMESVRSRVDERVARTSMRPPRRILPWSLAMVMLLIGVGVGLWFQRGRGRTVGPGNGVARTESHSDAVFSLQLDDVEVIMHIAAVLDERVVLVVWSGQGGNFNTNATNEPAAARIGKYRRHLLPPGKLSNGRPATYCLYVADDGVRPVLEPPTVVANAGGGHLVGISVSPSMTSAGELSESLRAAGLDTRTGASVADIYREIQKYTN